MIFFSYNFSFHSACAFLVARILALKFCTSYRPLSQFILGCSIRLLYFWWFRRHPIDVTPPKFNFTLNCLNHFVQFSIITDAMFHALHCIAELFLKMFRQLIINRQLLNEVFVISRIIKVEVRVAQWCLPVSFLEWRTNNLKKLAFLSSTTRLVIVF